MKKYIYSIPAKAAAYVLLITALCITIVCTVLTVFMVDEGFYTTGTEEMKKELFWSSALGDMHEAMDMIMQGNIQDALQSYNNKNFKFEILDENGEALFGNVENKNTPYVYDTEYSLGDVPKKSGLPSGDYTVYGYVDFELPFEDEYSFISHAVDIIYPMRYSIVIFGIISLVMFISLFVFLICIAGHKPGEDKIYAGFLTKIPFDLLAGIVMLIGLILLAMADTGEQVLIAVSIAAAVVVVIVFCMNFSVRVKLGNWWKNTVIFYLCKLFIKFLKVMVKCLKKLVQNIPLIWKTVIGLAGITFIELVILMLAVNDVEVIVFFWFLEKLIIIPGVVYIAIVLRKLQKAGERLAAGDLQCQADTKYMLWDFKQHGENLNSIADGMTRAVYERLKSERFKTELITNVSHDIKTPLTSVINYANLIGNEKTENSKIIEYSAVLLRQSERLKKLIEDLVEASKAATGNVDVLLAPCEIDVLLTQAVGEYEQRLKEQNLELIVKKPAESIKIMADGRRLWRVIDNLMNNICKYAQENTRVYLGLEVKNNKAIISFKNTSKYALDMSEEELMERFVRGDGSRNTEGNGLGLSIAKSLTELQKGDLKLTVDGDLFKVILTFDIM